MMLLSVESLTFLDKLKVWDKDLFLKINGTWISAVGDFIFPILRFPKTWIPLYVGLFLFMVIKLKWKSWPWVLMALVCILISDQLSSQVLKGYFERLRPCQDFPEMVRLLVGHCPGNASFPSSHAVNHFAIGIYFMLSLKAYFKKWSYLFVFWALSICYAQVYVGVHFPLDVLGGAVIGILIGLGVFGMFSFLQKRLVFKPH